jgi:hypothetical protein
MSDNIENNDNLENHMTDWHTLFNDFVDKNHIGMQRLVPELLGEFDNSWDVQQQLAYVLACLRRLARDQNILTHEFDSVADGLLEIVNKIMNEFAKEMTDEINKLWVEVNLLYNRKITFSTDDTLKTTVVGNWQNGDTELKVSQNAVLDSGTKTLNITGLATYTVNNSLSTGNGLFNPDFTQPVIALNTKINKEIQDRIDAINAEATARKNQDIVLQQNIDNEAKTRADADTAEAKARSDKDTDLQNQINNLTKFANDLITNLNQSGAYSGTSITSQGVFNQHIAYGNINHYGATQDGAYGIFTSQVSPNNSTAVGSD